VRRSVSPAGHDKIISFPQGLTGKVDQMGGAFRKLEMKGNLPIQELLAKKGEELPSFPSSGTGIYNDLYFSGNSLKQRFAPVQSNRRLTLSFLTVPNQSTERWFHKKLSRQGGTGHAKTEE